jgi:hypothetical protein
MDLLRQMRSNREAAGADSKPLHKPEGTTKSERTAQYKPGSKLMRKHIIEEKPGKKVVRQHFEAIIDREVEKTMQPDSSEED